jgi:predicted nucleic acid-binding protein
MRILFDTSALLKRYLPEPGREVVLEWVGKARPAVAAPHCKVEIYSALSRVRRDTGAVQEAYRSTCAEVERNFLDFEVITLTPVLEKAAIRSLESSPMRAMDALHVAAAIVAGVDLFVTADVRQYEGAQVAGLKAVLLGST